MFLLLRGFVFLKSCVDDQHKKSVDIRKIIYFTVASFITLHAIVVAAMWISTDGRFTSGMTYLIGVPFIYGFTPAIGLVWFVGHNTDVDRIWHWRVWPVLWAAWILWLYVTIIFFFGTTIELYQNGSN